VDLCAGLGGFHLALSRAAKEMADADAPKRWTFKCVMAADIEERLRKVYPRNFPEIVEAYAEYYPPERCAETPGLSDLYDAEGGLVRVHGDLAHIVDVDQDALKCWPGTEQPIVPEHELLCAGFPCQPFSKSGAQMGFRDLNGTVFRMLVVIIAHRKPRYLFLENVGNFERHDSGNTWRTVRRTLEELGYSICATTTVGGTDAGLGLLSPHHLGLPQHRERFFIVAQRRADLGEFHPNRYPFPVSFRSHAAPDARRAELELQSENALKTVIARTDKEAPREELNAARLSEDRKRCINHWRELLLRIQEYDANSPVEPFRTLPSFPIWGYELDLWHHYRADENPGLLAEQPGILRQHRRELIAKLVEKYGRYAPRGDRAYLASPDPTDDEVSAWAASWPQYAKSRDSWPGWKKRFIEQNRAWAALLWSRLDSEWLRSWLDVLSTLPASHQKLEWNCQGEDFDLWNHILQFRPSGLRVKRFRHIPALVAMTMTQIPIVPLSGGQGISRHLLASEALELQGFPRNWQVPSSKSAAFEALGNAVHVDLVAAVARSWLFDEGGPYNAKGEPLSDRSTECSA
jgi:DNA (cytosine-5)-methyltransferase 1